MHRLKLRAAPTEIPDIPPEEPDIMIKPQRNDMNFAVCIDGNLTWAHASPGASSGLCLGLPRIDAVGRLIASSTAQFDM